MSKCHKCGYEFKTVEQEITAGKDKEEPKLCAVCEKTANWDVKWLVDDDGHLNVFVINHDGSDTIELETGQDTSNQTAYRFTTEKIEENYKKKTN